MKETILMQPNSHGRTKFIVLQVEGDEVRREWGLLNGKSQKTANTYDYINKGKSNELSPSEAAEVDFNRIIETKVKEGYIVVDSLDTKEEVKFDEMDFDNPPESLCVSKPKTSISNKKLQKLIDDDKAIIDIKENGSCHLLFIDSKGDVKIKTRRHEDHTLKYPSVVEAVKEAKLPPNTVLTVELVIDPLLGYNHMESFKLLQSISKSDTVKGALKPDQSKSYELQEKNKVRAMVFNIVYLNGEDLSQKEYNYAREYIDLKFDSVESDSVLYRPTRMVFKTAEEAVQFAKDNEFKYEGLVVWDKTESIEVSFNGKPKRRAAYKLKIEKEDDVVAYSYLEGTGKKQGKIGSLLIGKYDSEGNMVEFGRVGSGLTDETCELDCWGFPVVIEIKYSQRFETGAYQFPVVVKQHEDKVPSEVVVNDKGF